MAGVWSAASGPDGAAGRGGGAGQEAPSPGRPGGVWAMSSGGAACSGIDGGGGGSGDGAGSCSVGSEEAAPSGGGTG